MNDRYRYDLPGTLVRPGPLGRLVRLTLGVLCLLFTYQWLVYFDFTDLRAEQLWVWVALSLFFASDVVNIGFGVKLGQLPRIVLVLVIAAGFGLAFLIDGRWVSEWAWQPLRWSEIYLYGHLGVSFVLAALLGTPGCEMRSIPDLVARLRGKSTAEHYCPGHIDAIDRLERRIYAKLGGRK